MRLKEIIRFLESKAPGSLQESYDNSGLLVGDEEQEISGALVCLDSTEAVIDEAISFGYNLVIAHHPIVFSGLKRFNGKNYIERVVMKAIKHDIAIYAIHTNLDNVLHGVNGKIADLLGLDRALILDPKKESLLKLIVYVPTDALEIVRTALFSAGAGDISNYSECSFSSLGIGTFKGNDASDPYVGKKGERHHEEEHRLEVILPKWALGAVLTAMKKTHPYEEVAHDVLALVNKATHYGSGVVGEWLEGKPTSDVLSSIKKIFKVPVIKHTAIHTSTIRKVAVCGGSGSFLLPAAIASGADLFITSDYKYHQFFDAEGKIIIADIGHFESEQFTIELLSDWLAEKFPTFAVRKTGVVTNPINYL